MGKSINIMQLNYLKRLSILLFVNLMVILPGKGLCESVWTLYNKKPDFIDFAVDDDYVWCASDAYLVRLDKQSGEIVNYPLYIITGFSNVYDVEPGKDGSVWFVTDQQNYPYDQLLLLNNDKWLQYDKNSELPDLHVKALFVDSRGILWIGTRDSGIVCYDGFSWNRSMGNC